MAKTGKQIDAMVSGAEWGAQFLAGLFQELKEFPEYDPRDIHHLCTPAGRVALNRLAHIIDGVRFMDFSAVDDSSIDLTSVDGAIRRKHIVFEEESVARDFHALLRSQRASSGREHSIDGWRRCHVKYGRNAKCMWSLDKLGIEFAGPYEFLAYLLAHPELVMGAITPATRIHRFEYTASYESEEKAIIVSTPSGSNLDSSYLWVVQF